MIAAEGLPVQTAVRILGVSDSGYYEWLSRPPSTRSIRHAWLSEQIAAVHAASRGAYGARRVHAELVLGHGLTVGHGTIELLMRRARPGQASISATGEGAISRAIIRRASRTR